MVSWDRFTATVPLLMISKVSLAWFEVQVVNSSNCRSTELVPQVAPLVGVEVGV